jgi:hypothetical protein
MRGMAADAQLGANFIVLLLVKLDGNGRLDHSATVYRPGKDPFQCAVVREDGCDFDNRISGVDERA